MSEEKLLTVRDVSIILGISEKKVMDLAESGAIPAYKIGGVYLRFKREQIHDFRRSIKHVSSKKFSLPQKYLFKEKVLDFLYFNDFYFLAAFIIALLLFIIFKG
jgi:excisionase family DNA binding protein